ncbi:MAG: YfhO family protein [Clostridiales bacterium]|nr:YfhO family protein [Clostridiales bacterium]
MKNSKLKNSKKLFTNKYINGETVSYSLFAFISIFLLLAIKQILKTFFSVPASLASLAGFLVSSLIFYLFEKRFVFRKSVLSSNIKQLIMLLVRIAANFGFYKLAEFLFFDILSMPDSFVWLVAIVTSFFFDYFYDRILLFDCDYKAEEIKGSRIYKTFFSNRFVLFSVALTAIALCVIYIAYSVFPFGDYTVMRMDLYHQYGPLFAELYDRIVNHQSLLYSWESGGGSSFLGNYLNYLSSPLTTLIFLFDKEDISFAITTLVFVKCILSAGTFTYYVKKSLGSHCFTSASFGALYAFCAYFMAYYWNVMWLDGMILLPLILLGIEQIINKGDTRLYLASLAVLFVSSYYMGYMSCIFAVLYFLAYFVIASKSDVKLDPDRKFKKKYSLASLYNIKFINRGIKFALASIASVAICAITLVPVFMILRGSSATSDTFPNSFTSYFSIFDFITSHFAAVEETIRSSGDDVLPNVYCGIITILLVPLYVVNSKIRFKEKAAYIVLLIFLLFSFDNNCANFIWHAFHFPNDLPYRFSYMYSFILLIIGYRALMNIKSVTIKDIGFVGMAWVFFACVAQKLTTTKMDEATIYVTIAFIIIWTGFLMIVRKGKINAALTSAMAVVFVLCEITVTDTASFVITQNNEDYKSNYDTYTEAIDYIEENDDDFYRTELCYLETRMDPSYYGYNGMSVFSSMAYETFSGVQYSLGMFGNRINSYTYNTQTPVYNLMFGIKYLIGTDISLEPSDNLYDAIYTTSDEYATVYENKYYLPIAYCVNQNIDDWIVDEGDPFVAQGNFFSLATGYSDVFEEVEYLETNLDSIDGNDVVQNGTYWVYKNDSESTYGYEDITIYPTIDGNVYIYLTSPDITTIEVSSEEIDTVTQYIDEPYVLDLGYHLAGEEITISIDVGSMESEDSYFEIYCYSLNEDVLKSGWSSLAQNAIEVTSYSDTEITGTVTSKKNCYLYSSIPFDEGWKVYVDGEETEIFEIGDAMLGIAITAGEHEITYKYSPTGLKYGAIISAAAVIAVAGYFVYKKRYSKESVKNEVEIV